MRDQFVEYAKAKRLFIKDGTVWPAPDADPRVIVAAYCDLLSHPWGASVSCRKLRQLRRAYVRYLREVKP